MNHIRTPQPKKPKPPVVEIARKVMKDGKVCLLLSDGSRREIGGRK